MAVGTSAICGTFKREILAGIHFLTAHTRTGSSAISADAIKIAMFTNSSSIDADTTGYTVGNEVSGTNYTAGGNTLASITIGLGDNSSAVPTAFVDCADTTWANSTISNARGALIYNGTLATAGTGSTTNHAAKPSVAVINFGGDKSSSAGDFTIQMPTNDANSALIRIA
jgi:hypothetical protein|tara:strand:+ start:259 stop:768 length:510 start_codon:yes stop_codon:yes gene_type:complete